MEGELLSTPKFPEPGELEHGLWDAALPPLSPFLSFEAESSAQQTGSLGRVAASQEAAAAGPQSPTLIGGLVPLEVLAADGAGSASIGAEASSLPPAPPYYLVPPQPQPQPADAAPPPPAAAGSAGDAATDGLGAGTGSGSEAHARQSAPAAEEVQSIGLTDLTLGGSRASQAGTSVNGSSKRGPRPRLFKKNTCQADSCSADLKASLRLLLLLLLLLGHVHLRLCLCAAAWAWRRAVVRSSRPHQLQATWVLPT